LLIVSNRVYERSINPFTNKTSPIVTYTRHITTKKNTQTLIYSSKEVGPVVSAEDMLLSPHQNARPIHNIRIDTKSLENVAQFRYLGTTVTNQNLIQEEIKSRLNSGNACYHSVQNLSSSHLLSKA
jgi:hypothetical protein